MTLTQKSTLIAVCLLSGALTPPVHAAPIMQDNTVAYTEGGIGDDQTQTVKAERNNFDLHITTADRRGEYTLADSLTVTNGRGKTLISASDVDPLFYADLPAGRYTVAETNDGQREVRTINVSAHKPANLYFTW